MKNQKTDEPENKKIDAFILYNEQEQIIDKIVEELEANNVSTHFWKRDVPFGDPILELEDRRFREADKILIFLGEWGWGKTHLRYAHQAQELNKQFIPILIGNPPDTELDKANAIFRKFRYIDLREFNAQKLLQLLNEFPNRPSDLSQFDDLINDLINGDEKKRSDVLQQILKTNIDRTSLAARLRQEIRENFSPENEKNYSSARRSPINTPSIRSWMLSALIRSDAEHEKSRELLLRHVDELYETHNFVRYWTLAGLYNHQASYLNEALDLALKDSKRELTALAEAIKFPNNVQIINGFRKQLRSSVYDDVWAVLRVLRIIPIPELTDDVCNILRQSAPGSHIAYDVLQALSTRTMANEAVKKIEINRILDYIISATAYASSDYVTQSFTVLLAAFNPSDVNRALSEAENTPENNKIVSQLRFYLNNYPDEDTSNEFSPAPLISDMFDENAIKFDPLGIRKDVQTLCAVMLSKTLAPPLAIGLFGDWGTGKSFFIKSLMTAVENLASGSKDPKSKFCSNVVQIEFNAWHYSDTNLWASLVSYILARLATYVAPQETHEERHAALLAQLDSAKVILNEAEIQKANAEKTIAEHKNNLKLLQLQRQETEVKLSDLSASAFTDVLLEDENLKDDLTRILQQSGISTVVEESSDLKKAVSDVTSFFGGVKTLFHELWNKKSWFFWLIFTGILIFPILFYAVKQYISLSYIQNLAAKLVWLISLGTSALIGLIKEVKPVFEKINTAKTKAQKVIDTKRKEAEISLQNEIDSLRVKEQETAARVTTATTRVIELEERIRDINDGRSLNKFLTERTNSEDYRKHLGIISTIRQDFDSLRERLDHAAKNIEVGFKPVDRIILYIDDLDRCSSDKVMDVLQAVHLLLAYPLFVVVVGVDPRWLLHSLEDKHSAFQNSYPKTQPNANVWRTTPQNYLEKIFQIPFNLKPMTSLGYGKLIDGLFTVTTSKETEEISSVDKIEAISPPPKDSTAFPDNTVSGITSDKRSADTVRETENNQSNFETSKSNVSSVKKDNLSGEAKTMHAADGNTNKPAFVIYEEALVIKNWESDFAKKLFTFIPTPRAAKRFSNIYRLLKAGVRRRNIARFEGTQNDPGEFRIPMLLLAMLIGNAAECIILFPTLQQVIAKGGNLKEALKILENPPSEEIDNNFTENSRSFIKKIKRITETLAIPDLPEVYAEWIPQVARFSFDVGRVVKADSNESLDEIFL